MSAGIGCRKRDGILLPEPMQDRPALKAPLSVRWYRLPGSGLVPRQEPHLDEDREGARTRASVKPRSSRSAIALLSTGIAHNSRRGLLQ